MREISQKATLPKFKLCGKALVAVLLKTGPEEFLKFSLFRQLGKCYVKGVPQNFCRWMSDCHAHPVFIGLSLFTI